MKKLLSILLIAALILCMVGCSEFDPDQFKNVTDAKNGITIWVDRETGVNYVYYNGGYGGGLAPRYNADGTLYVSEVE